MNTNYININSNGIVPKVSSTKIRELWYLMMFFPAAILFLVSGVLSLPLFEKHEDLEPVDIISVKHLQINSYTGPLTAEMFKLLKNVEILELSESNFTLLEDRLLHNLPNLRKLSISNSHIVREVHDISSCCQKLKEIEMINSGLSSLPWNQIGVKWPIETIYLFREKTPELEANILVDKKLKHLTLIHSDLEKIDEGAFNGVNHLETLNLENNKIGKITKRTLEPLKTLKELNLSHNLLEEITADQIPNLPHLEKLNIGHNPIKKINLEEIKKLLPKLTTLDVSGIDNIDLSKVGDLGDLQLVKTAVL